MKRIKKFDILILLFVIGAMVVFAIKLGNVKGPDAEISAVALVDVLVEDVRIFTVDSLKIGDVVLSEETDSIIGIIENIEIFPYKDVIEKFDGKVVLAEVPYKYAVLITVKANLIERETGYFADGTTEIKVNSETTIYTKSTLTSGSFEGIEWQ